MNIIELWVIATIWCVLGLGLSLWINRKDSRDISAIMFDWRVLVDTIAGPLCIFIYLIFKLFGKTWHTDKYGK